MMCKRHEEFYSMLFTGMPSSKKVHLLQRLGPGRLCQHNFKHNRLSILVRIMLD